MSLRQRITVTAIGIMTSQNSFSRVEHFLVGENLMSTCHRHCVTDMLTSQNFFGRIEDFLYDKI